MADTAEVKAAKDAKAEGQLLSINPPIKKGPGKGRNYLG
jgi:hypothetical protein